MPRMQFQKITQIINSEICASLLNRDIPYEPQGNTLLITYGIMAQI